MTTLLLAIALLLSGGLLCAVSHAAVRVAGICAFLSGALLWAGLDLVCGTDGPLMNCWLLQ